MISSMPENDLWGIGLKPNISVVALNYNTRELLASCLESLNLNCDSLSLQLIVVDNASRDGSAQMIKEQFPDVDLIENSENLGSAQGTNQGIRCSNAPYVLILNPDTIIKPGVLRLLHDYMESNPRVGIVGPRLVGISGEYQQSCHYFTLLKARYALLLLLTLINFKGSKRLGLSTNPAGDATQPTEVDWIYTACALVRREVFDDVGLLDDNLFFAGDDMELCYRAKLAGWKVVYLPEAEIIHYGNQSAVQVFGDIHSYKRAKARISGLDYFLRKHFNAAHSYIIRTILGLGSLTISALLGLVYVLKKGDKDIGRRVKQTGGLGMVSLMSLLNKNQDRAIRGD